MKNIEIIYTTNVEEVKNLVEQEGYCPVECSFGSDSVVDELCMEHHGKKYENNPSVAINAYKNHFGARADNPKFVINHVDADNTFAIAALAGILPHPNSEYAKTLPPYAQAPYLKDLTALAETVATIDTDPIGRDILKMPYGRELITFDALFGNGASDATAAMGALQGWRILTTSRNAEAFLKTAEKSEQERRDAAQADMDERGSKVGSVYQLDGSRVFGFDVWYGRKPENGSPNEMNGWGNPLVIAFSERGNLVFGCPNKDVAKQLLGEGGLRNLFEALNKEFDCPENSGFGGHESVGGSPRGHVMSQDDLAQCVAIANRLVAEHNNELRKERLGAKDKKVPQGVKASRVVKTR